MKNLARLNQKQSFNYHLEQRHDFINAAAALCAWVCFLESSNRDQKKEAFLNDLLILPYINQDLMKFFEITYDEINNLFIKDAKAGFNRTLVILETLKFEPSQVYDLIRVAKKSLINDEVFDSNKVNIALILKDIFSHEKVKCY